jgi:hypothetical protein
LRASIKSVIPESAVCGYPESRENNSLLDTGSRPPSADSSGMTFGAVSRIFQQSASALAN